MVLSLLLLNFVSGSRLELIHISLIVNVRLSLIHLHGFQLLVLLSQLIAHSSEVQSAASYRAKLLAENFSEKLNLDSGIAIPAFPSGTNLKLHNISVTSKLVKNVITNLHSSKAPGPDCISVVILKNFKPEFSYILT